MSIESDVTDHYAGPDLLAAVLAGLAAMGESPETVSIEDLAPVDEFHIGGRTATTELCERLGVTPEADVLDVGCGIGGAARFMASTFGCRVTGIDLTPTYIEVARTLSDWTGLAGTTRFEAASALDMPFADNSFDRAVQLHLGMNIVDKAALFTEVARVLRPGGRLGLYDVMRMSDGDVAYPVPWASDSRTDLVADLPTYREALEVSGLVVGEVRERSRLAAEFFDKLKARIAAEGGPPPLGLHVIMGPEAQAKVANMVEAVKAGVLAPVEILCDKPVEQRPP
jgi:SAM-dependent methyltransferase